VHMHVNNEPVAGRLRSHTVLPIPGEQFEMVINCEAMHLFDPVSEQRLSKDVT